MCRLVSSSQEERLQRSPNDAHLLGVVRHVGFTLGEIWITPRAPAAPTRAGLTPLELFSAHVSGYWSKKSVWGRLWNVYAV